MTSQKLPNIYVGDAWMQAVTISQAGVDFTGFTLDVELFKMVVPPTYAPITPVPTITSALDPDDPSIIAAELHLTEAQTTALGVGFFMGRLRLTSDDYGPTTILEFNFNVIS
jgi:hypothetical protein